MKINRNFDSLAESYLFARVAEKTEAYAAAHPDRKLIKMGIGDVTLPLAPAVVEANIGLKALDVPRDLVRLRDQLLQPGREHGGVTKELEADLIARHFFDRFVQVFVKQLHDPLHFLG